MVTLETRIDNKSENTSFRRELPLALGFFVVLFAAKAVVTLLLYKGGYLEYDGDGFTRSVHAWEWLQQPRLEVDAWLPLQFWLNGTLMNFWPDLFWEPRAINLLASLVTVVNFFFIGRHLFGKAYGYGSAFLVALFPWEIWFSLSGMAESLTHMFLSLGVLWFVRWTQTQKLTHLTFASLGFLGATTLRYEAWFYSLLYAAIVLFLTYRRRTLNLKVLFSLSLTFVFALIWVITSWVQKGKPWAFVSLTSEINANLEGRNQNTELLEKLIFYPRTMFNLLPWLVILAVVATGLLFWKKVRERASLQTDPRPYLLLIWGEFALFITTTLPTNNIAPGSARYPVSNLLLLTPVVCWLIAFAVTQGAKALSNVSARFSFGVIVALLAVIVGLFTLTTLTRTTAFPDSNTRQIALWFKAETESGKLPKNIDIPAHLPNPKGDNGGDYAYIYGLTVLTNRPDGTRFPNSTARGIRVISDIEGFQRTIVDDKPKVWLNIETAGDKQAIVDLQHDYRQTQAYGPFSISAVPLYSALSVTPDKGALTTKYTFNGDGYEPGEAISVWVSWANGSKALPPGVADAQGHIKITFKPEQPVTQSLTARGSKSGRQGSAEIQVSP